MKEKIESFFTDKVVPRLEAFSKHRITKAIMTGMAAPISMTIIGSVFAVLQNPPADPNTTNAFFRAWINWSQANAELLTMGNLISMKFIAVYALLGIVVSLAASHKVRPINMLIISLSSFVALAANPVDGGISTQWFGAAGLFSAVIIGVVIVEFAIFIMNKGIKIKLPETVPPNISEPLEAMIMNFIVFTVVLLARQGFIMMGTSLPELISGLFAPLFVASDTLGAVIIYILVVRLCWFFGLHGGNISSAIVTPFITANMIANVNAYAANEPLPCIFTIEWTQTWTVMGILALCVALMIVAKSSQLKTIAAVGFVPAIFTIGEPITFGVPTVLNFTLFIPYMVCFLLDGIIPYLLTQYGLISRTFIQLPGITPGLIESFLNALDWRAPVFWIGLLALNVIIFIPFVKKYDAQLLAIELACEEEMGMEAA